MADDNRLLEELRKLKQKIKTDPDVLRQYDLDGNGEISGHEWDRARQAVIERLDAESATPCEDDFFESAGERKAPSPCEQIYGCLQAAARTSAKLPSHSLLAQQDIVIQQKVEALEVLTGFSGQNRYVFLNTNGDEIALGIEKGSGPGGALKRNLPALSSRKPFTLDILINDTSDVLTIEREMHSMLTLIKVFFNGKPVGEIHERVALLKRSYSLKPFLSIRTLEVAGSPLNSWTYTVQAGDKEVGQINKKWKGFLQERCTSADSFMLSLFERGMNPIERMLVIAAAIVIDIDHFE